MEHILGQLKAAEATIRIASADPVAQQGFTQVPNFILRNPELSLGAKAVYALLLSYAWHNDFCFPGQEKIAADMGVSRPSVNAFIKQLEACKLLTIERRGLGKTNIYTIHFTVQPVDNRKS